MATSRHRISPEIRLKRFLYTCSEDAKYITGNAELHDAYTPEKLTVIPEMLNSQNPDLLLNIIEIVNSENLIPRSQTILFALALAASSTVPDALKHNICTTLLNVIKTSEDLCTFLKFYTKQKKKIGTSINKVISSYYSKKDPLELADEVARNKGYHSWTHKDLIKLSHCKCDSILSTIVIHYILFGLERAKAAAEGNSSATNIIDKITKMKELKSCENESRIVELISELNCDNLNQVPSFYHNSQLVWEVLVPRLSLADLLKYLPKLYKLGFLKANTPFQCLVIECLTNVEKIQSSKIHPVEVFMGLKNFEKGGKPIDPQFLNFLAKSEEEKKDEPNFTRTQINRDPPKCPQVISALHKLMQASFQNPQPTGRKIMITIELSDKMQNPCLSSKNISCLEAATIFTLSLLRVERDVTVAVFCENRVNIVSLEKNITYNQAITKLKQTKCGYVLPSAPFDWASVKKKKIDLFIHFMHYHHWFRLLPKDIREKEKPLDSLNKYRKKMSLPHTKLLSFSLSSPHLSIADGSLNVLDIGGFSKEVPKVVEAFSKGSFY